MRVSKETIDKLKARAKAGARRGAAIANNAKPSAIAAAVGGIAAEAVRYAKDKSDTVKDNWYIPGAALIVGGHLLRKKSQAAGLAAIGAGGVLLAQGYRDNEKAKENSTPTPTPAPLTFNAGAPSPRAMAAARRLYAPPAPRRVFAAPVASPAAAPAAPRRHPALAFRKAA